MLCSFVSSFLHFNSCPVVFISLKRFEIFILFLKKVPIFSLVQVTENIFRGKPLFHQSLDFKILLFLGLWRTDTKVTRPWVTGDTTTPPTSPPTSRCIPRSRRAGRSLNKDSECRRQRRKVRYQNACGYSILPVVLSSKYCACLFNLLHLFPESWYSEARLVSSSEFTFVSSSVLVISHWPESWHWQETRWSNMMKKIRQSSFRISNWSFWFWSLD